MSKPDVEFSYDSIADGYAGAIDEAPYNAHYERPAMLGALPPLEGTCIMEAGCGPGWYTEQLLSRGARVTALDASPPLVEHTRRRIATLAPEARARAEVRVADLREPLDFAADGSFDGIVSALVMHYMRDWSPALAEFRRVLKPGGWFLFSTHHPAADGYRLKEGESYFDVVQEEDHWKRIGTVRFYRRPLTAISGALADAGFGIERIIEPRPTEAFRAAKPDAYERLMRQPEFLLVRARPW
ncbi:MAG TPA: class I SAM-dependent methyltransferase [Longimicrobium sp.]|nr:class I SAM-dependent methyltransferase [Longimicrobium sp.]